MRLRELVTHELCEAQPCGVHELRERYFELFDEQHVELRDLFVRREGDHEMSKESVS